MNISSIEKISAESQESLIKKLSQYITPARWELMQKVIQNRTRYISLILEDIYQSHNAAAVIRSCDGFGIQDIHVIENHNKLSLNKTTVAKGADKWLNFYYYNQANQNNTLNCISHLKSQGYRIAATTLGKNSITLETIPL
ncbi:MAG: rRNA methyltransferase, partial [Verrucomicrobia bacterium]